MTWPEPGSAGHQGHPSGILVAVARLPGDGSPCALSSVADRPQWTSESEATARALATIVAARIRRVEDARGLAERRVVTDALIHASPDAVVMADAERRIVEFNPAAEELDGRRRGRDGEHGEPDHPGAQPGPVHGIDRGVPPQPGPGRVHRAAVPADPARDGTERMVELTPLPLVVGGQAYFWTSPGM